MSELSQPSERRWRPVRLTDIPVEKRMSAAQLLCRYADEEERAGLILAALRPSSRTYWVAP